MKCTHEINLIDKFQQVVDFLYQNPVLYSLACQTYEGIGLSAQVMRQFINLWKKYYDDPMSAFAHSRQMLDELQLSDLKNIELRFNNASMGIAAHILSIIGNAKSIADIGSGRGHLPWHLANMDNELRIIATEITWDYLSVNNKSNLDFRLSTTSTSLPLKDEEVEAIIIADVFHHIDDDGINSIIAECWRSLKHRGKLIFIDNTCPINVLWKENNEFISKFFSLPMIERITLYLFSELFSHEVITRKNMPMYLNIKSLDAWSELFRKTGFKLESTFLSPTNLSKLHQIPKYLACFQKNES